MSKKLVYLMFLVLVLGLTTTVANADIGEGLVAYWPLDEGEGTTTTDLSGNDNDGTLVDAPGWDSGKFGGALNFDGVDDYVDCGNPPILDFGTGDWTVSAWIKVSVNPGDNRAIFSKGMESDTDYQMRLRENDGGDVMIRIDNLIDGTRYNPNTDDHPGLYTVPGWHHIVGMRRDGTKLRVYVDGVDDTGLIADGDSTIPDSFDLSGTSTGNAYIGAVAGGAGNPRRFFVGLIDDVALWDRALTDEEVSYLWNNGAGNPAAVPDQGKASKPSPPDGAIDVPRDVVFSWTPGDFAPAVNGHKFYFSEDFYDVNDGIGGIIQDANSYTPPQLLDFGKTYYWRVDEVSAPPDSTIFEGEVWKFTVEPFAYPIAGDNIIATASSTSQEGMGPENTINGLGLDVNDMHSTLETDMWLSGEEKEPNRAWIEYELDKVYKLHEMWVWNSNQTMEQVIGLGFKDVTVEYSTNGTDYTPLGTTHEFARALGTPDYAYDTTVDFNGAVAKYIKITANSNWGDIFNQYGLSEVRFFNIPVSAREPSPDSGTTDVAVDVTLGFRAGREAARHDVYLSTDEQAVIDGNAPVNTVTDASYSPVPLDLGSTYYWRIDEVNETETPTTWQGDIWNFMTHEYFVVDDFEDYNDYPPDEIWSTWVDGYGVPANGAAVGYPAPDWDAGEHYVETAIVHGGEQAMPFFYDNTVAIYSEATVNVANLQVGQDWAKHGIKALTLRFYGDPNNSVEQMYVRLNDSKVTYDGDAENLKRIGWQMWYIDLADFGPDLSNVTELSIGFERIGAVGGQGVVYLDGIRLYSYDRQLITPTEPGTISLQAHYEFEGTTNDSSGNARHGARMGNPTFVAGKVGQAINLRGLNDYVETTGYKGILGPNAVTVTAWIKTTSTVTGTIVGWGPNVDGQRFGFRVNNDRIRMEVSGGNLQADSNVNDGGWHHVAVTVQENATISYPDVILYVDGIDDTRASTDPEVFNLTAEEDVRIGSRPVSNDRFFMGQIDDVRIYDRALSQEEVAWLGGRTMPFDKPF